MLWLHTSVDPAPEDWARGIELTLAAKKEHGLRTLRQLVLSDGGAPNTAQRKQLSEQVHEGQPSKLAVVTSVLDNPVKRGIATALSWVNPSFRAVPVAGFREAFRHVDLESEIPAVLAIFRRLQEELPPVAVLEHLERATGTSAATIRT